MSSFHLLLWSLSVLAGLAFLTLSVLGYTPHFSFFLLNHSFCNFFLTEQRTNSQADMNNSLWWMGLNWRKCIPSVLGYVFAWWGHRWCSFPLNVHQICYFSCESTDSGAQLCACCLSSLSLSHPLHNSPCWSAVAWSQSAVHPAAHPSSCLSLETTLSKRKRRKIKLSNNNHQQLGKQNITYWEYCIRYSSHNNIFSHNAHHWCSVATAHWYNTLTLCFSKWKKQMFAFCIIHFEMLQNPIITKVYVKQKPKKQRKWFVLKLKLFWMIHNVNTCTK